MDRPGPEPGGSASSSDEAYLGVVELSALPEGRPHFIEVQGRELALYRVGSEVYATDDACPHADGPLSQGDQAGTKVTCPYHGWDFCLKTGACLNVDGPAVKTYPCRVVDGTVQIAL
jgi:NAD(P)H-dependent nitrite reductase small subunit